MAMALGSPMADVIALPQALERRVVVRVRPPHVDPRQRPCDEDDERAEQHAQAQAARHEHAEKRFIEGDEKDEAEIDRHHRDGE